MAAKHRATTAPGPGDGLVRAGAVVFVVGVVAVLADLVPFFLGHPNRPLLLNVAAFLAPVGLGMALLGLARSARASQRQARARARAAALEPEPLEPTEPR